MKTLVVAVHVLNAAQYELHAQHRAAHTQNSWAHPLASRRALASFRGGAVAEVFRRTLDEGSALDPNLFHLDWERTAEVLAAVCGNSVCKANAHSRTRHARPILVGDVNRNVGDESFDGILAIAGMVRANEDSPPTHISSTSTYDQVFLGTVARDRAHSSRRRWPTNAGVRWCRRAARWFGARNSWQARLG